MELVKHPLETTLLISKGWSITWSKIKLRDILFGVELNMFQNQVGLYLGIIHIWLDFPIKEDPEEEND